MSFHTKDGGERIHSQRLDKSEPVEAYRCEVPRQRFGEAANLHGHVRLVAFELNLPFGLANVFWHANFYLMYIDGVSCANPSKTHRCNKKLNKMWPRWEKFAWARWSIPLHHRRRSMTCDRPKRRRLSENSGSDESDPAPSSGKNPGTNHFHILEGRRS